MIISEKLFLSSQYITSSLFHSAEYTAIFISLVVSLLISCIVFGISYIFSTRTVDKEKVSAYECGFNPFEDARNQFDVRFYLVAILFIIFDLEVMFLIPFSISLNLLTNFGLGLGFIFIIILAIGILYEWRYKALSWVESK